ncbi:unnamed protein product [Citrullus colocynthis]|uniref:Uncharacterized protein n=1 Tax=Citrullus colocynthis TaxID=252529 RepID=A0ABP0XM49_9ROSI
MIYFIFIHPLQTYTCWVYGNLTHQQGSAVNYCQPPIIHLPPTALWLSLRHVVLPIVVNPSGLDSSYNRWNLGGADQGDLWGIGVWFHEIKGVNP